MDKHTKHLNYLRHNFGKMMVNEMMKALSDLETVVLGKGSDIINVRKGNSYIIKQGENQTVIEDSEIKKFLQEYRAKGYVWYANLGRKPRC